ncbi:universal stress protein [Gordonia sp. CPCC 205515]|uniref:universal stress protein n=1 Tax=Gordonia sp. CPCC 205515 TaxID=3140791 RepID=UPI003AF38B68
MRVLVAYLATSGGADAVAVGVRLARTLHADLDIAMVVPQDRAAHLLPSTSFDDVLVEQTEQWLAEAAEFVPADVPVSTHVVLHDSVAGGLIAEAQRLDAAALVVGGAGGGLIGGHTLGSVVNELLHSSPVPILLSPRGIRTSLRNSDGSVHGTARLAEAISVETAIATLEWHADQLITAGSSRPVQPRRLTLGSTAAKKLRTLDVPMLVIPPVDAA